MQSEMAEQPERLAALLGHRKEIGEQVRARQCPFNWPAPCSWPAVHQITPATCGAYFSWKWPRGARWLRSPSLCTLYRASTDYTVTSSLLSANRGRRRRSWRSSTRPARRGARAIAITNDPASPLAGSADLVVDLGTGQERAVPATKTVTAQLAAFAIIAQALGDLGMDDRAAHGSRVR